MISMANQNEKNVEIQSTNYISISVKSSLTWLQSKATSLLLPLPASNPCLQNGNQEMGLLWPFPFPGMKCIPFINPAGGQAHGK